MQAAGVREHALLMRELSRRGFLQRAGVLGAGALVLAALPGARHILASEEAAALLAPLEDPTLEAFADTIIPGRGAARTDLGHAIHPKAIAGVDDRPGAVEADALALYKHPLIGFERIGPAFLADLERRALPHGGPFLELSFEERVATCVDGFSFDNPARLLLWEAAASVPFTAFCAAALVPEQTAEKASGYRVMGHPGKAPRGYSDFSYGRALAAGRTARGSLP
jgi:hypothetical protein